MQDAGSAGRSVAVCDVSLRRRSHHANTRRCHVPPTVGAAGRLIVEQCRPIREQEQCGHARVVSTTAVPMLRGVIDSGQLQRRRPRARDIHRGVHVKVQAVLARHGLMVLSVAALFPQKPTVGVGK